MQSICPQSLASGSAVCQKQQQQPTSLEHAQHTVEELQLMARPLKATMATLIQLNESSSDGTASLSCALLLSGQQKAVCCRMHRLAEGNFTNYTCGLHTAVCA